MVANITSTGLVSTGVGGQNTTATATFNLFGTPQSDDFEIHTFCFEILEREVQRHAPGNAPASFGYYARFIGPKGIELEFLRYNDDGNAAVTYSVEPNNVGVSLNADNEIVVDSGATVGTPFSVVVTYTDPVTGFAVTAPIELQVQDPTDT